MTEKLDEIRQAIKDLERANLEALEALTRHETDLRWVKGSIKICFSAIIAAVLGSIGYLVKIVLNMKGI